MYGRLVVQLGCWTNQHSIVLEQAKTNMYMTRWSNLADDVMLVHIGPNYGFQSIFRENMSLFNISWLPILKLILLISTYIYYPFNNFFYHTPFSTIFMLIVLGSVEEERRGGRKVGKANGLYCHDDGKVGEYVVEPWWQCRRPMILQWMKARKMHFLEGF